MFADKAAKQIIRVGEYQPILQGETLIEEKEMVRAFTMQDLNLVKRLPAGTEVDKDVNCDSF